MSVSGSGDLERPLRGDPMPQNGDPSASGIGWALPKLRPKPPKRLRPQDDERRGREEDPLTHFDPEPTRTVTGWYAGRHCRWSTDHKRQERFDNPSNAVAVCYELRDLCPRSAKVINIEVAEGEPNPASGSGLGRLPAAERVYQRGHRSSNRRARKYCHRLPRS